MQLCQTNLKHTARVSGAGPTEAGAFCHLLIISSVNCLRNKNYSILFLEFKCVAPDGNRTHIISLAKTALFPLSYRGIPQFYSSCPRSTIKNAPSLRRGSHCCFALLIYFGVIITQLLNFVFLNTQPLFDVLKLDGLLVSKRFYV